MDNNTSNGGGLTSVDAGNSNIPQKWSLRNSLANDDFEDLKARVSIYDVAAHYGMIPDKAGKIHSIFTDSDSTPSLQLYGNSNSFFCFSQQKGGSQIDFIMAVEGISKKDALSRLAAIGGLPNPINDGSQPIKPSNRVKKSSKAKPAVVMSEVTEALPEALTCQPIDIPDIQVSEAGGCKYTTYEYSTTQKVVRRDDLKTGKKSFSCYHLLGGEWQKGKGESPWYPFPLASLPPTKTVIIAEGEKDCLSLLQQGIPAVTAPGHSCSKNYYSLMAGMLFDRGISHCFIWPDYDSAGDKKAEAIAQAFIDAGIFFCVGKPEEIFSGMALESGFGASDYFSNGGTPENILKIVNSSEFYACGRPDKSEVTQEATEVTNPDTGKPSKQPSDAAGEQGKKLITDFDIILDDFICETAGNLKYVTSKERFFRYAVNRWEMVADAEVMGELRRFIRADGYLLNSGGKLKDLFNCLKLDIAGELADNKHYLCFEDGALNLQNWKLIPHSKDIGNTWILARKYECDSTQTPVIDRFLGELTNNNSDLIAKIKCFLAACIRGLDSHQKFLHLLGSAGSGKGTLMRLIEAFIGTENTAASSLESIETDKFEGYHLWNKKLVVLPDEHRQPRQIEKFLKLVANDSIRCEEKFKPVFTARFGGVCVVGSNFEVFASEAPDAVARRRILIPCNFKPITPDTNLQSKLQAELPALTRQILEIPVEEVQATLASASPVSAIASWEERIKSNSIAAWMNDYCFLEVDATSAIGKSKDEILSDSGSPRTLYGSYGLFCRQAGYQPVSLNRFSADLITTARTFFKFEVVKFRSNTSRGLKGIRFRKDYESPMDECLKISSKVTTSVTAVTASDNPSDNLKPLHSKESDNRDNLNHKPRDEEKNSPPLEEKKTTPPLPTEVNNPVIDSDFNNVSKKVVTVVTPPAETQSEQALEVGDNLADEVVTGCHSSDAIQEPESLTEQALECGDSLDYDSDNLGLLTIDDMKLGDSYIYLSPGNRQGRHCKVIHIDFDPTGYPVIEIEFEDGCKSSPQPSQLGRIE